MPFIVNGSITELVDETLVEFNRGDRIADERLGEKLHALHPGLVTRHSHDDDLCLQECKHEAHPWNVAAPKQPAKLAPEQPAQPEVKQ